jgi:hypothetical protein
MDPQKLHRWLMRPWRFRSRSERTPRRTRRWEATAETLEGRTLLSIQVTPHSNPVDVLSNVQVVNIFYGNWTNANMAVQNQLTALENYLNNYISDLSGSAYLGVLAQYGVSTGQLTPANVGLADVVPFPAGMPIAGGGRTPSITAPAQGLTVPISGDSTAFVAGGTVLNNFISDRNANGIMDLNNIEGMINGEIANVNVPAPNAQRLYFVWTSPGINVMAPDFTGGPTTAFSTVTFGGYHFFTNDNMARQYAYAVVPLPSLATLFGSASAINPITAVASHELGEATSDPHFGGWFYINAAGEIGDLAAGQYFWITPSQAGATGNTYFVQRLWSNFIARSTYPHALPLVGGNPGLPGVVNSPQAVGAPVTTLYTPGTPTTPTHRPDQPQGPIGTIPTIPPNNTVPSAVEPTIASSSFNSLDLALASQNGVQVSTNDGATWSAVTTFPISSSGGDSSLVYDKNGNLYWSNLNSATNSTAPRGISLVQLDPTSGAVVAGPFTVDAPGAGLTDTGAHLAADSPNGNPQNKSLFMVWVQLGASNATQVLLSSSTNNGATWSTPVVVATGTASGAGLGYLSGATVSVGPGGTVYVSYHSQPVYTTTADGGIVPDDSLGTLSGQTIVASYTHSLTFIGQSNAFAQGQSDITFNVQSGTRKIAGTRFLTEGSATPQILADPTRSGYLYVVTANDPNDNGATRIVFASSTNNGATWTTQTLDTAVPASSFQLFPTATIDQYGDIVVTWYANANGETNGSGDYKLDVFATYSTNGGQSFSPVFQVNDAANPFDPDAGTINVLPGVPPGTNPTTTIGNFFGVTVADATAYVAHDGTTGMNTQQVVVNPFALPGGTLSIPSQPGNNTITIRKLSSTSDYDVVLLNNVTIFSGPLESISGGIVINHLNDIDATAFNGPVITGVENDSLVLDFSNGDPIPTGGLTFIGAEGGNNSIAVNANSNYTLSNTALTIDSLPTIILGNVQSATLTGGSSSNVFTLSNWSGTTTINGAGGTVQIAAGTVNASSLTLNNVASLQVTGGTLVVDTNFSVPTLQNQTAGTLTLDSGVTLTANVSNDGIFNPGAGTTPGSATIHGNFMQTANGIYNESIGSATQFNQLIIMGVATLGGTIDVTLLNGFQPTSGSFSIMTYSSVTGDFAHKNGFSIGNGHMFTENLGATSLTLVVM